MSFQEEKTVTSYPAPFASSNSAPPPPYYSVACTLFKSFRNSLTLKHLFAITVITVIIFVAIMPSVWFMGAAVLEPDLPKFQVESASVSPLAWNRSELTAAWNFTFLVRNPNHRLGISYHKLQASVYYKEIKLNTIQLPSFHQKKGNETTVRAGLSLIRELVGGDVKKGILSEKDVGTVHFEVQVFGRIRYTSGWLWTTMWLEATDSLSVYCDGLRIVYLDNNGSGRLLESKPCEVNPSIE